MLLAVPPANTISLPPLLTVAPVSTPPDRTFTLPPLLMVTSDAEPLLPSSSVTPLPTGIATDEAT